MIPNEEYSKADHPTTRVVKESIHDKKTIPKEILKMGDITHMYPIEIDEKTTIYVKKEPTDEKIAELRKKYSQRNLYGKPNFNTDEGNKRTDTERGT
jgi:hypothetical protein